MLARTGATRPGSVVTRLLLSRGLTDNAVSARIAAGDAEVGRAEEAQSS